jgi:hypothetical protein
MDKEDLAPMPEKPDVKDRRMNVFVSPEAKRMLRNLGQAWYPNLKRRDGTVIEQLIRLAHVQEHPVTNEPYVPQVREQQIYGNPMATALPDHSALQRGIQRTRVHAHSRPPQISHRGADPSRISDELEKKLDQIDEQSAYLNAVDDDDL